MATIEDYRKQYNDLQKQKSAVQPNTLSDVEKTALASKLANTQTLMNNYVNNVNNLQSSKAEAYSAKQNAIANANVLLGNSGYGSQGMAQTTMANIGNAYSNQLANANAEYNRANSDYFKTYQEQLNEIEQNKYDNQVKVQDENYNSLVSELEEIMPTHLNEDTIENYKIRVANLVGNGELSNAQKNQLFTILDGYREQAEVQGASADASQGTVDLGSYLGKFKDDGKQTEALNSLKNNVDDYVARGLLKDGDVIDINYGKGTEYIVYKNGKFYKATGSKYGKAKSIESLDDLYNNRLGVIDLSSYR